MKRAREDVGNIPIEYLSRHSDAFEKAVQYILSVDSSLLEVIVAKEFPQYLIATERQLTLQSHFKHLASGIITQQISGAAARSIKSRVEQLFGGTFPNYVELQSKFAAGDSASLRKCGLSARKVSYVESLTAYFNQNEMRLKHLFNSGSDAEIVDDLVRNVKGIGPWSAKMFLVTSLHRQDVFAADDLGIARGCSRYLTARPEVLKKLMVSRTTVKRSKIKHKNSNWRIYDEDIVESCGQLFKPHRTLFMFILWRLSSTNIDALLNTNPQLSVKPLIESNQTHSIH
ncbi:AFR011Wp [Eremothecium gossypii ATCC 10895]|uniref:AFR011Wp n=1 Tax=Eremothecium gossypii (strain ATCC 10895 / CBS 109.51 / FGSC 9923 / NRRL Y-1056) TaxID=284811 RepID=Q754R1_EREGS|nr:AFR011Wp [Eremothecium gossypii ATCC 10895]AAS53382.1 AFR011Wp [Eremothecium gossypii ATCC 10895]AEY97693.1 FAFR011Wp [Eremothecium gossypii FDAG1]